MEFSLQGIWNYSSHYDIVNIPNFIFSYVKTQLLEVLRKPFKHLKVWFTNFDLKKITFKLEVKLPCIGWYP